MITTTCPICDCIYYEQFKYLNCESFDDSYLYKDICIHKCNHCGHLYNELTTRELQNLMKYYKEEYAPSNLSSKDKETDRPGDSNPERYEQLLEFIKPYIYMDSRILDVGCASGGFLDFLWVKGYKFSYGIEPVEEYVKNANERVKVGNVYNIPFEENSFDIIILDQVLEHLAHPKLAMKEIERVLDKGGLCYIGVPDVNRYNDNYFYIMREHVQHFSLTSLKLLAEGTDFELVNYKKSECDMIGSIKLPNLSILLKLTGTIYCWGIGREFMYLYPNTRLKYLDLILVDDTPEKQKRTFKGMKIHSNEILKQADKNSFLIITALAHKELLQKKAKEIFYGEIIDI